MANEQSKNDGDGAAPEIPEKSDSSDSDSDEESDIEYVEMVGPDDSDDEDAAPAPAHKRAEVAMFTWSCPKSYPKTIENRKKIKHLKPADLSKQEQTDITVKILRKHSLGPAIDRLITVDEPHKSLAMFYS